MSLKGLPENSPMAMQPRLYYPEPKWNYDESEDINFGLMLFDFEKENYRIILDTGSFTLEENEYLYFVVSNNDKNRSREYKIARYQKTTGQLVYSEAFFMNRSIEYFEEKQIFCTSKYIIIEVEQNGCAEEYYIFDKNLNKVFMYQMKKEYSLNFLYVTERGIYVGMENRGERYITTIKFDNFTIIEKPIKTFLTDQSNNESITYSETVVNGNVCLSYDKYVNEAWYDTRKIVNIDLEIEQQYCFVQPVETRFLATAEDAPHGIELWIMRTSAGLKVEYKLIDYMSGQILWATNLGSLGYDTAGWGIQPVFWKDKIIFSGFEKGKKGNGILVLSRATGQVELFKRLKGNIKKMIPRKDGVYIQCESKVKYTYYYKLCD